MIDAREECERVYAIPIRVLGEPGLPPAVCQVACGAWHVLAVPPDSMCMILLNKLLLCTGHTIAILKDYTLHRLLCFNAFRF